MEEKISELDYNKIGLLIKKKRVNLGLTQSDLSDMLDISPNYVSSVENGKAKPSLSLLCKIGKIFDCTIDELVNGEELLKDYKRLKFLNEANSLQLKLIDDFIELLHKNSEALHD